MIGTSEVAVAEIAETGPVLKPSVAASATTVTTTSADPVGVTAIMYDLALVLVNVPFAPPVTVTSPASNPVTSSENVKIAVNAAVELILVGTPVILTVGAIVSSLSVTFTRAELSGGGATW